MWPLIELYKAGGAIPESKYKSSTLVGFRHPVTDRHYRFSSVSRFMAWDDLVQTGVAYSAVDYLNTDAVVGIVLGSC